MQHRGVPRLHNAMPEWMTAYLQQQQHLAASCQGSIHGCNSYRECSQEEVSGALDSGTVTRGQVHPHGDQGLQAAVGVPRVHAVCSTRSTGTGHTRYKLDADAVWYADQSWNGQAAAQVHPLASDSSSAWASGILTEELLQPSLDSGCRATHCKRHAELCQ
jgi:hypothetical protein